MVDCSNFGHFAYLSHPWKGGGRDNVRCSSWAHCKARSGLSSDRSFSLDVTAEALRGKIERKSAISLQRSQFHPKFQVEGDVRHQSFSHG